MAFETLTTSELSVVVGDNEPGSGAYSVHRAGYNGVWSLTSTHAPETCFSPAVAGLNLEHLMDDLFITDEGGEIFEPRVHPMQLKRTADNAVRLSQESSPLTGVSSETVITVREPFSLISSSGQHSHARRDRADPSGSSGQVTCAPQRLRPCSFLIQRGSGVVSVPMGTATTVAILSAMPRSSRAGETQSLPIDPDLSPNPSVSDALVFLSCSVGLGKATCSSPRCSISESPFDCACLPQAVGAKRGHGSTIRRGISSISWMTRRRARPVSCARG